MDLSVTVHRKKQKKRVPTKKIHFFVKNALKSFDISQKQV